jgi:alkylation response protein AidB-like acyl-CoA dehydrogenase
MDFGFTEEQNMLRDSVRKLMDKHAPVEYIRRLDKEQAYPYELYDAWAEAGLFRMPFPEEYGGLGGSLVDLAIICEELSYRSADLSMAYGGTIFCALNVLKKGSEEQKRQWLPKVLSGELKFSISMSEPEAGSDVGAMRTTARRVVDAKCGDHYVINGQKLWATGAAAKKNVINVYVKTDTKANYRAGMSLFLVPNDTPGIKMRKLDMLGRRCTGTYECFYDDVKVPAENLVGGENKGFEVVLAGLQSERATSAANAVGASQAIVDLALSYSKERKQFGRPIGTNQAIAHMIADMATEVEAARTLMWRAVWLASEGRDALREITMAKLYCSETYVKVAQMGMQILGGYGYNMEFDMQRYFRDSRAATIAAGTSQIQRNLIAGLMGLKVQ